MKLKKSDEHINIDVTEIAGEEEYSHFMYGV